MDRRDFFCWLRNGLAGAAAPTLLLRDGSLQADQPGEARPTCPHFTPKAKRAIHICLCGAMSHVDSFDHKPALIAAHGQSLRSTTKPDVFFGQVGRLRRPDWEFRQRGQSGLWVSELFPHIGEVADELTVIRSMVADTSNHTPATFQENSGFRLNGFPAMGAWLSYGLGSESDDLPAFVVIPDAREFPAGGSINWSNGFLPARHQGVVIRPRGEPIDDLFPVARGCARRRVGRARPGRPDEPAAPRTARRRRCAGRPHTGLRDGRPHANVGSRGHRPRAASQPRRWRSTAWIGTRPPISAAPA